VGRYPELKHEQRCSDREHAVAECLEPARAHLAGVLFGLRGLRGIPEGTPLFHHRLELGGTRIRLLLVADAHALDRLSFEVWVASVESAPAHEPQIHSRLAIPDERREVAALARRERHSILDALVHAGVGAEDDVTHAPHRTLRRRLRPFEPSLDRSGLRHAPIVRGFTL